MNSYLYLSEITTASHYLEKINVKDIKKLSPNWFGSGTPDFYVTFKDDTNAFVESKNLNKNSISLRLSQLDYWVKLCNEDKEVVELSIERYDKHLRRYIINIQRLD